MNVESETEPVQKEETKQLVERKQGNDWYLIDKETGEKATGFQRLEDRQKKFNTINKCGSIAFEGLPSDCFLQ